MNAQKTKKLAELVRIRQQYQRSIRLDADLGRMDALDGYVCHKTAADVLDAMAKQISGSNQRAFTWTGPFGGGKSSLAIALASALAPDGNLRAKARDVLRLDSHPNFDEALPVSRGWLVLPVVGRRGFVSEEISKALNHALGSKALPASANEVVAHLCSAAADERYDGVLLVIDEMGKFLEAAALGLGDDVYFFQDLAESAARAQGKIVVIGVLHQSFRQYASRLGSESRDDWAKVQGRFADIPLVAASDEVVELIGRAFETSARPQSNQADARIIASSMAARRPAISVEAFAASLDACWPLHPAMAALLGPVSRRQFGQNERSTFGFLGSVEPHGFRSFLKEQDSTDECRYRPDHYWDYLRINLEPAILSSPDGHRWAQAADAVERTEAHHSPLHSALIKSIAVIDLLRSASGLAADFDVLRSLFPETLVEEVDAALEQLSKWRVAIYKKHLGSWSVFEGSDFDIEKALTQAKSTLPGIDFSTLTNLANLYPAVAKRHYHNTGTLRWMEVALCRLEDIEGIASKFAPKKGEFGLFLLALPSKEVRMEAAIGACERIVRSRPWPVAVGIPPNYGRIEELGLELVCLQSVQGRPELEGDQVGKREVTARISAARSALEEQLRSAVTTAIWTVAGRTYQPGTPIARCASDLADDLYRDSPRLWSELINRDAPSSASVKARRDLIHAMLENEHLENLGFEAFPAERGLYESLLKGTSLHRKDENSDVWRFQPPDHRRGASLIRLWEDTRKLFSDVSKRVEAVQMDSLWASEPFGIRSGVRPILMTAFLLAHKGNLAVYKDGMFVPSLNDADLDEYLQDERRFSFRWVVVDDEKTRILSGISSLLASIGAAAPASDPLEAAKGLVALVFRLPNWTKRTATLSPEAREVRDILAKASDPHRVLFMDLAAVFGAANGSDYVDALRAPIIELAGAYEAMLRKIESGMLDALDAPANALERLRARAELLKDLDGELRQNAFAGHLAKHDGSLASIERIVGLAVNKPARDWTDRDFDQALLEVARLSLRFRQSEALVAVRGRKPMTDAFAVVIGAGASAKTISRQFDLSERHRATVDSLADELAASLKSKGLDTEILLAALARVGLQLTTDDSEEIEHG
ncbi:ATP-binding protein [Thauera sp. WH-1]|uniref:ATP-binding protein n=1 Tax=Thauera sp. WH-1 TaxID=3398230 RepID=UPI0039FDBA2D